MYTVLTVINYPRYFFLPGLFSMAIFRIVLWRQKRHSFLKLMGSGFNGSFDIQPEWHQWVIFSFTDQPPVTFEPANVKQTLRQLYGKFIARWCEILNCECCVITCEIKDGHGTWDGRSFVKKTASPKDDEALMAVLTRATIRMSKLFPFWKSVRPVNDKMKGTEGLIYSIGIGEAPFTRQATFSVWQSKKHMQSFAYSLPEHRDVIERTRKEKWYAEEMFLRLAPIHVLGTVKGRQPFIV